MEDEGQTHVTLTSGRTIVTSLLVTLLGERQIRITVDSRDGKLAFEWVQALKLGFSSSSISWSSLGTPSLQACGTFVSPELMRLLGSAQVQLNNPQYFSRILDVLEELRLNLVMELVEELLTSLHPKGLTFDELCVYICINLALCSFTISIDVYARPASAPSHSPSSLAVAKKFRGPCSGFVCSFTT